jgi:pseudouridine kinase
MLFEQSVPFEEQSILVIGAAGLDIVGRLLQPSESGASTPASIRPSYGGTSRNFAENLARLGMPVTLLSVIGTEPIGRQMLRYTRASGVNVDHVIRTKKVSTGAYIAVINDQSKLQFALDDMEALFQLTPEYIESKAELFEQAAMVFMDANLLPEAIDTVIRLAQASNLPVIADPTSSQLANRLLPHLPKLSMVTPNIREAAILSGIEIPEKGETDRAIKAAQQLVSQGLDLVIITLAEFGVVYATSETNGHIPAIRTRIVDPTGAGDALSAAVIFALLNNIPVDEAIRLGISAASLTLRHPGAVRPDLSLELLYDQLI